MDPTLQRFMALIESKKKSNLPWKRQEPCKQPYYSFSTETQKWHSVQPKISNSSHVSRDSNDFSVLSWNIDFMLPFEKERMTAALSHLQKLISTDQKPCIVFLQEMTVPDLELIQSQSWIRSDYNITDVSTEFWESGHYGTCSLIPKSLPITSVFRVHYEATKMERDGLFVDVSMGNEKILRLCNTHLESLVADPPLRPKQVEIAARFMRDKSVVGSVLGGDLNAIQPFDKNLHSDNDLGDAYLTIGGEEDKDEGYTWGQMAPVNQRERFGCSRMDKLFYCGQIKTRKFETFGLGVSVEEDSLKDQLMTTSNLDGGWITDHLGVKGVFTLESA